MVSKAFQKGFIDGFLSPFTFFMPPEKRRREPDYLSSGQAQEKLRKTQEEIERLNTLINRLNAVNLTAETRDRITSILAALEKINYISNIGEGYRVRPLPDVSIGAAWEAVGRNLSKAMAIEAEEIHAGEQPKKQKTAGKR